MKKICIFAGTTEGRELVDFLRDFSVDITVCVATEYGESLIDSTNIHIHQGRMDENEITDFIKVNNFFMVIDCTHPFAKIVTDNVFSACQNTKTKYKRVNRESSTTFNDISVSSVSEAADYLKNTTGNILCTLGSKELSNFDNCDFLDRFYARVLPMKASLDACEKIKIPPSQIIAMQGPFSYEMNSAIIDFYDIKILLTKETGSAGGFDEKIKIAQDKNLELVVVTQPLQKEGYSLTEIKIYVKNNFEYKIKKHIDLIACGVGNLDLLTPKANKSLQNADVIIGAKRLTDELISLNKPIVNEIYSDKIADYIKNSHHKNFAIALSGDIGFYSGAKKLYDTLSDYEVESICGISSLVYLSSMLKTSWEDVKLISLHGRENNIISNIINSKKVFTLLGGKNTVHALCHKLIEYNLDVTVSVGENLSYKNEKITTGKPKDLLNYEFESLSCAMIFNDKFSKNKHFGFDDDEFIRTEKVPMTKSEVRAVSLSKLRLSENSVAYDIGAGTGSVAIEVAMQIPNGQVFAIEKNTKAIDIMRENKLKFKTDNLTIIDGFAPLCLSDLPAPTEVFIGGSSGNLREIITNILKKNPKTNFVVNAVTLETLFEAVSVMKDFKYKEVVQVNVSKAKELGNYNLMMANNPINIITFRN